MKLVLTKKEFDILVETFDDGQLWGRELNDPRRTLLEKIMAIKDKIDAGETWAAELGTVEKEDWE